MESEKPKASEKEIEEFLNDFSEKFSLMDKELISFDKKNYSSLYLNYDNVKFLKTQIKLEDHIMIGYKIGKLDKNRHFKVLNLKQVESINKKGYFKILIKFLEKWCEKNKINLLVSQILNTDLEEMLRKHDYTILKEEYSSDINAIKIYQDESKTDTGKRKSRRSKRKSRRSKRKSRRSKRKSRRSIDR